MSDLEVFHFAEALIVARKAANHRAEAALSRHMEAAGVAVRFTAHGLEWRRN